MAFRRKRCRGSGIRMTGYNYKLIALWIAREHRRRGSGYLPPKYHPFKLFGAKRKELLDPILKKVALAMKRAKRT